MNQSRFYIIVCVFACLFVRLSSSRLVRTKSDDSILSTLFRDIFGYMDLPVAFDFHVFNLGGSDL